VKRPREAAVFVEAIDLNDPPANTYSYDMMREIDAAVKPDFTGR
jgi:hypothetical protein